VTSAFGLLDHLSASRIAIAFFVAVAIAAAALRLRALSVSGAAAAVAIGTAAFGFGGPAVAAAVIAFFLSGTVLSRVGGPRAKAARSMASKGSTRDAVQVLANGGVAAACAVVAGLLPAARAEAWIAAAVGAIAVAAADTWATEIGALSTSAPRSIATWRVVLPGASGGITALGTSASALGGGAIAAVAAAFGMAGGPVRLIALGALIGLAGSAIDSILGAALQCRMRCDGCGQPCESSPHRCGASASRTGGLAFLDNDGVNAISTVAGAALGWLAATFAT
jgi:uncharacterized protein (TIGR00297 family)